MPSPQTDIDESLAAAKAHLDADDPGAALQTLETGLETAFDSAALYLAVGRVLDRLDRVDDAALAYRRAAISDPSAAGLTRAGSGLYSLGRYAMARAILRMALELEENSDTLGVLGLVQLARGNRKRAITILQRATELAPEDLLVEAITANVSTAMSGPLYDEAAAAASSGKSWSVHFQG